MYTTLKHLKQQQACAPGFGNLLAFFGTSAALKEQKIPLHAVALISGPDDVEWLVDNALIIDPVQWDEFYRRTLPFMWKYICSDFINSVVRNDWLENEDATAIEKAYPGLVMRIAQTNDYDSIKSVLEFLRFHSNGQLGYLTAIAFHEVWNSPIAYMKTAIHLPENKAYTPKEFKEDGFYVKVNYGPLLSDNENLPKRERLALFLKPEGTYDFLWVLKHRMPQGLKVKSTEPGKVSVSFTTDERGLFEVLRSLNKRVVKNDDDEQVTHQEVSYLTAADGEARLNEIRDRLALNREAEDESDEEEESEEEEETTEEDDA